MKKIAALLICLTFVAGYILLIRGRNKNSETKKEKTAVTQSLQVPSKTAASKSLFVPYWSLSEEIPDFGEYDQLLYFGITPTKEGINTEDSGYLQLPVFVEQAGNGREKLLVLRMLDAKVNFAVLDGTAKRKNVISETIALAQEYGFKGILLDLELAALPFDSLVRQINAFNSEFFETAKKRGLSYGLIVYGDVYYRARPFDMKTLVKSADQVMIMAYDMHKAGGNPGPNFPLAGKEKYGYDYSRLIDDFLAEIPPEKLTVIFGLYGYDWQVDGSNIAQQSGKPLSYLGIKRNIIDDCQNLKCKVLRDRLSGETKVGYTEEDGTKHIVWYEDMDSAAAKQDYLKSRGIDNFSFWAYSYF